MSPFVSLPVMLTSCQLKREGLNVQVVVATIHGHNQKWWKTKWRPSSPLPTPPANPRGRGGGGGNVRPIPPQIGITSQCPVPSPPTDDRAAGSTPENRKQGTPPPPPTMSVGKNPTLDLYLLKQISPFAHGARPSIWPPPDIRRHRSDG